MGPVIRKLTAHVEGHRIGVIAGYLAHHPWSVTLTIYTIHGPVIWTLARDLLRDGVFYGAGIGDVVIWLAPAGVFVTLRSPQGRADLLFASNELLDFIEATEYLVPLGSESQHVNWAREIKGLMQL